MTAEELKAIQMYRQHLCAPADVRTVAHDLLGVQAQFLGHALHALQIRCENFDENTARKILVKSWTIRGTMHLFDPADLPLLLYEGRPRFLRPCDTMEDDGRVSAVRKRCFANVIVESVRSGVGERESLRAACRAAGMTAEEEESVFNAWGGLLRALCENGALCHQVGAKKTFALCPPFVPMKKDEAECELLRRYYANYGPATLHDATYFFGWTHTRVKRLTEDLPVGTVGCGGREYYFMGETNASDIPDCLFLAGFDQLLLGYRKTESLFLPPEHLRGIFSRAGMVMPAVLLRGRVVGRWKREKKKLFVTAFEPLPAREKKIVERAAEQLWGEIEIIF